MFSKHNFNLRGSMYMMNVYVIRNVIITLTILHIYRGEFTSFRTDQTNFLDQ